MYAKMAIKLDFFDYYAILNNYKNKMNDIYEC